MFNELSALLNLSISVSEVKDKTGLPIYLAMRKMYTVSFSEVSFILVDIPQNSEPQIRQLKKQLGILLWRIFTILYMIIYNFFELKWIIYLKQICFIFMRHSRWRFSSEISW